MISNKFLLIISLFISIFTSCFCGCDNNNNNAEVNSKNQSQNKSNDVNNNIENNNSKPDPADTIYDQNKILNIEIKVDEEDWNTLRYERRSLIELFGEKCMEPMGEKPYNYYPATVIIDETELNQVGVRTKGLLGSINPSRPSIKVKVHQFDPDLNYKTLKRFTFNNQNQDPARIRSCLSYKVMTDVGVPASRCNFAHLIINDSDMGIYANVEPIKRPFLLKHYKSSIGNLYESTAADLRTGFIAKIEKKNNVAEDNWTDLENFIKAIESDDDVFLEEIEKVLDLDAFLTYWATEVLIAHWDSFSGNSNNYYFYRKPDNNKFYFIPWGPDSTFTKSRAAFSSVDENSPESVYAKSLLTRRLYNHPEIREKYKQTLKHILENVWNKDELLEEVERIENLISPYILEVYRQSFNEEISYIKQFIAERKEILLEELNRDDVELIDELPKGPTCMIHTGDLNITMNTTWGTQGAENPFNAGSGTMAGSIYNNDLNFTYVGSTAGIEDFGDTASLTVIGLVSQSYFMVSYITLPASRIKKDETVIINGKEVSGFFLSLTPPAPAQILGFLGNGTIKFTEASTIDGEPIKAEITTEIWGGDINP